MTLNVGNYNDEYIQLFILALKQTRVIGKPFQAILPLLHVFREKTPIIFHANLLKLTSVHYPKINIENMP